MSAPSEPIPERVLLPEEDARAVLLVRAVEEADRAERLLDGPARRRASTAAAAASGPGDHAPDPATFLAARAAPLAADLATRFPAVRLLAAGPRTGTTVAAAAAAGLVLGLASNLLGPERRVHVLWNPVLLLVAWNLAVYLALFLAALRGHASAHGGPLAALVAGLRTRLALRLAGRAEGPTAGVLAAALLAFSAERARALRPLFAARLRVALHLGALAAALGALGGTYLRGLVLEYSATWESTFLSAEAAGRVLGVLLGPALALTGAELPPLEELRAPASQPAAPWIHLFALTVLLVVVVPRTALASAALATARRLTRAVPVALDAPYWRRLLAPARGTGVEALVVPYGTTLEGRALDALRALLAETLGARASVRVRAALDYGDGAADVPEASGAPRLVVVFGLQQTPEAEVHGRFLAELAARGGEAPLVLVDASRYRAQLAPLDAHRIGERRRAWDAVVRDAGARAEHVDLLDPSPPRAPEEASAR